MPIQQTQRRSGIYARRRRTLTLRKVEDEDKTDFERESKTDFEQIGREIVRAYTPQTALNDTEAKLIGLLKAFGVKVHWPGPLPRWILTLKKWPTQFNLRDFGLLPENPNALLPDPEANADAFDSVCKAMDELIALRKAMEMNLTADAAMRGFRLGRLFEMLQVIPHESAARNITRGRQSGTARVNAAKKKNAETTRAKIIAEFKIQKQLGGKLKKVEVHKLIATQCNCSERTVRTAISQHEKESAAKR